jgi:hypothetical protein
MAENSSSETLPEKSTEETPVEITSTGELLPLTEAPKNDTSGAENSSDKIGLAERIRNAGEQVATAFKIPFKKGKGRPKNCRACGNEIGKRESCAKCGGSGVEPGKADTALPPGAPVAPVASAAAATLAAAPGASPGGDRPKGSFLLRRVVVNGVKGAKSLSHYALESKANEAGLDEGFIEQAFRRATPTDEKWKNFDESTGLVLEKYNIKTESDELLCFLTDLGALFACDFALLRTFQKEIARRKKEGRE